MPMRCAVNDNASDKGDLPQQLRGSSACLCTSGADAPSKIGLLYDQDAHRVQKSATVPRPLPLPCPHLQRARRGPALRQRRSIVAPVGTVADSAALDYHWMLGRGTLTQWMQSRILSPSTTRPNTARSRIAHTPSTTRDSVRGTSTKGRCFAFGGLLALVLWCLENTAFQTLAFRSAVSQ